MSDPRVEAYEDAIQELQREARWQQEQWARGDPLATRLEFVDRLLVIRDILGSRFIRSDPTRSAAVGEEQT